VSSAGHDHGNYLHVEIDGQTIGVPGERGIGLVILEKGTRQMNFCQMFDTYLDPNECTKLNSILFNAKPGNILILGVKDDGSRSLNLDLIQTLTTLGSKQIQQLGFRDSWAFVVRKGKPNSAKEAKDSKNAVELSLKKKPKLRHLLLSSSSYEVGNCFSLTINDKQEIKYEKPDQRGIVMIVLNREGNQIFNQIFDTYASPAGSDQLESALQEQMSQSQGHFLILGVKDEGSRSLTHSLRILISSLGSEEIQHLAHRESWCFLTRIPHQNIGKGVEKPTYKAMEGRSSSSTVTLSWIPKTLRATLPPSQRYTIQYLPPSLSNPPSEKKGKINRAHSPDLYHHSHLSEGDKKKEKEEIFDQPIQSVHHRYSTVESAGVDVGTVLRNNRARRRETLG